MRVLVTILAVIACAETASATPVDANIVPRDAGAVIHIDLDAVWKSKVVSKHTKDLTKALGQLTAEERIIAGLVQQAQALTVWLDAGSDAGAIIVKGIDPKQVKALLLKAPKGERLGKRTLYHLDDGYLVVGRRYAIATDTRATLNTALEVIDGKRKHVSPKKLRSKSQGQVLIASDDKDVQKLVGAINLSRAGSAVEVKLRMPGAKVLKLLESAN